MSTHSPNDTTAISDVDIARAWHALSDHGKDGAAFDEPDCACRHVAPRVRHLLDWFIDTPVVEPSGLGAVVVNPISGQVWVRAAHPHLRWKGPDDAAQQWADPTTERWYVWDDLPRPIQLMANGWEPPVDGSVDPGMQAEEPGS